VDHASQQLLCDLLQAQDRPTDTGLRRAGHPKEGPDALPPPRYWTAAIASAS
jgi:hypothetical protein